MLTYAQRENLSEVRRMILDTAEGYEHAIIYSEDSIRHLHERVCDIYVKISDLAKEIEDYVVQD